MGICACAPSFDTQAYAMTQCRKFKTNISKNGIAWPKSQFPHPCVCERFICIFPRSFCLFCCRKICGPILGIHKWDFCCSVIFTLVQSVLPGGEGSISLKHLPFSIFYPLPPPTAPPLKSKFPDDRIRTEAEFKNSFLT